MSQVSICEFPDLCIFEILKCIRSNCESGRPDAIDEINYADLNSFAASCEWFAGLLIEWDTCLYIKISGINTADIDFGQMYARLRNNSAKIKERFWSCLSSAVRDADSTKLVLRYAPQVHPEHKEAFRTVTCQLKNKLNLNELEIDAQDDVPLDHNEAQAIAQIATLTRVKCGFEDPRSIGQLSQLTRLRRLEILSRHDFGAISEQVLTILKESKKMMWIELVNLSISYGPLGELVLLMKGENVDASDYSPLATLPGLSSLEVRGSPRTGSLKRLLAALALGHSQTLEFVHFFNCKIDTVVAEELAQLKSLCVLECEFADPLDIQLLSHLPELKDLLLKVDEMLGQIFPGVLAVIKSCKKLKTIRIWCNDPVGAVDVKSSDILVEMLEACQDELLLSINGYDISFDRKKEELHVEMDFFKQNSLAIGPLARLESVNHIQIYGYNEAGSLREFFAILAMRRNHDLQSLSITDSSFELSETTEWEMRGIVWPAISSASLPVDQDSVTLFDLVSRIPTLKSLKLSVVDTQGIRALAESLHLEELTLSFYAARDSLEGLFRALSRKDSPKLKNLVLERTSIDSEEARLLVQVASITSLACGFKHIESFCLLANMTNLESLQITSRHDITDMSGPLLDILRGCLKLKIIDLGSTYGDISHDLLQNALEILKSVRNASTQGPLEIRRYGYPPSDALLDEYDRMPAIDKTYLTYKCLNPDEDSGEETDEEGAEAFDVPI